MEQALYFEAGTNRIMTIEQINAEIAAPAVCPLCGEPSTPEYAPCGHGLQNMRKCD